MENAAITLAMQQVERRNRKETIEVDSDSANAGGRKQKWKPYCASIHDLLLTIFIK
ncbi:hypothetical protein CAter282_2957 [Collimonas arenae]|uniref:Uncharacterized protein n=1 Tax=Collimonas arenae TaxID=279058 RepID=A0A127QKW0_9BURK|nr:hypothetical protein [Collimonas arenae]AMP00786.1 hypothetical protein CAter10_3251 [Collimonas arenae]AMP10679.1 hypothetical protein CAter282_2957 [Collimonas arenae]